MKQQVLIINGRGGAGKDTICACAAQYYRVRNISSITPVVEIARAAGWNGEKTLAARRMLSKLKAVFTEFNDLSFRYCMDEVRAFRASDAQLLFIHVREPEEIARLKQAIGPDCRTLLVQRPALAARQYGNRSDDEVDCYPYDLYFDNDVPLDALPAKVQKFFQENLK